jgi:hypothetical protein
MSISYIVQAPKSTDSSLMETSFDFSSSKYLECGFSIGSAAPVPKQEKVGAFPPGVIILKVSEEYTPAVFGEN